MPPAFGLRHHFPFFMGVHSVDPLFYKRGMYTKGIENMTNSATKRRRAWNSVVTMAAVKESGVSLTYIVNDSDGSGA